MSSILFNGAGFVIYDDRFKYKDGMYSMADVTYVEIKAIEIPILFLRLRNIKVTLSIKGRGDITRTKFTFFSGDSIFRLYQLLAKWSLPARMEKYLDQMKETGGFHYRGANIYSNGEVFYKGYAFNLKNCEFDSRRIRLQGPAWYSPVGFIYFKKDKDVILALLDFILKRPMSPENYMNWSKNQDISDSNYLVDVVSLMAKISKADGRVSKEEIIVVKNFLKESLNLQGDAFENATTMFQVAKDSPAGYEFHAHRLKAKFSKNPELLVAILDLLFKIALADGEFSAEEQFIFEKIEDAFEQSSGAYAKFRSEQRRRRRPKIKDRAYYLNILGLSMNATDGEIKRQYKRLVLKFHPDRVHHKGTKEAKEAEERIKVINEAYSKVRVG